MDYSLPRTTLALALWLGGIHFNVLLVLASLFLLSRRTAAMSVSPIHPPYFVAPYYF
jgi:2-acylglycerol O-acyltransferase 2